MDRKSNCTCSALCLIFQALFLLSVLPSICSAKDVTLGWNANSEPDVEGYVVYRNTGSPGPPFKYADDLPEDELVNPLKPRVTLTGLAEGTRYYVAVTAYDTQGNESRYSHQLCVEIVDSSVESCGVIKSADGSSSGSGGGGGGGAGCFIASATGNWSRGRALTGVIILSGIALLLYRRTMFSSLTG
jgi:hypothetical protein